jgi:hypothetical protein
MCYTAHGDSNYVAKIAMELGDPDFDKQLTIEQADVVARLVSTGKMHVYEFGDNVLLCQNGKRTGDRLQPYQMTRRGVTRAVADCYPTQGTWTPQDVLDRD